MSVRNQAIRLDEVLKSYGRVAIALSGGIDSAFLLQAAVDALGVENILAVTAVAPNFSERETCEAKEFAKDLGVEHHLVQFDPMSLEEFANNTPDRCYHCKKALFMMLWKVAGERRFPMLADGANVDDLDDYRPGMKAVHELGVASPLLEAGIGKKEIRLLAQKHKLPFWNKPSFACLASRIPCAQPITPEKLAMVEQSETCLFNQGFRNFRVRHHGDLARIEVDAAERAKFFSEDMMEKIVKELKMVGFRYVALDLQGYRTGSMNAEQGHG